MADAPALGAIPALVDAPCEALDARDAGLCASREQGGRVGDVDARSPARRRHTAVPDEIGGVWGNLDGALAPPAVMTTAKDLAAGTSSGRYTPSGISIPMLPII